MEDLLNGRGEPRTLTGLLKREKTEERAFINELDSSLFTFLMIANIFNCFKDVFVSNNSSSNLA